MKQIVLLQSQPKVSGGLEKTAKRIADAFLAKGGNVTVLSRPVKWPSFLQIGRFDNFVQEWLKTHPTDIVFGMDRNRFQTHIRAGNGCHIAYLKSRILAEGYLKYYSCLLNPMHRKILKLEKEAFENPALKILFVNSQMVKNEILHHYNIAPDKVRVVHNGVEWDEMEEAFNAWPEKKAPDTFTFLFIGNGYLRKGLKPLLQALALLNQKNVNLLVVGKDKNLSSYQKLADQLGLTSKVQFFGPQSDIYSFYQRADALVIPSFYDPFANVTVEALAMGLRVVSSTSNGGAEILTPETGFIIKDLHSIHSIRDSLLEAISHPKTIESALKCRNSVQHLIYSNQLKVLIDSCYEP